MRSIKHELFFIVLESLLFSGVVPEGQYPLSDHNIVFLRKIHYSNLQFLCCSGFRAGEAYIRWYNHNNKK